jgi:hypothetical protein
MNGIRVGSAAAAIFQSLGFQISPLGELCPEYSITHWTIAEPIRPKVIPPFITINRIFSNISKRNFPFFLKNILEKEENGAL